MLNSRKLIITALACLPLGAVAAPQKGDTELTLSGSGTSDNDFEANTIGVTGSYGWYLSSKSLWGIRQTINTNFDIDRPSTLNVDTESDWSGATRVFYDYHFGDGNARPFIGASLGGTYGDAVNNTFFAGPELGLKYYVRDQAFLYGMMEYQFYFDSADEVDTAFDDGAYSYSVGIGLNF